MQLKFMFHRFKQEEFKMNRLKVVAMICCWTLASLAFTAGAKADEWNKTTQITFSAPFEVPGVGAQVLPAGTYIFKLLGHKSDRHVVQILNESRDHVYATILAIPNYRFRATDKTVVTFKERAVNEPPAIRAWFYPGNRWGQEFVYPKKRAMVLAKMENEPVLSMPEELAPSLAEPIASAEEPQVIALNEAPIEAVKPTGEVVPMAEVVEPPPVEIAEATLPKTGSLMPLLGLIGLTSIAAGLGLSTVSKRPF
jgi:hypothetical protein